jgi:hypothetical protein
LDVPAQCDLLAGDEPAQQRLVLRRDASSTDYGLSYAKSAASSQPSAQTRLSWPNGTSRGGSAVV